MTAEHLEEKFDRGEDVLDYFDVRKARVIRPQFQASTAKAKLTHSAKRNSKRATVVREKSARYSKKK
jgi:hypothetical protein